MQSTYSWPGSQMTVIFLNFSQFFKTSITVSSFWQLRNSFDSASLSANWLLTVPKIHFMSVISRNLFTHVTNAERTSLIHLCWTLRPNRKGFVPAYSYADIQSLSWTIKHSTHFVLKNFKLIQDVAALYHRFIQYTISSLVLLNLLILIISII